MGVNRVDTASGEVIMDISDSTVTPETLAEGEKAYDSKGEPIVGTMLVSGGSVEPITIGDKEWNGSEAVDFTDTINNMIDEKVQNAGGGSTGTTIKYDTLLPETTAPYISDVGYNAVLNVGFTFIQGRKYVITYNGTQYTCTAVKGIIPTNGVDITVVGNTAVFGWENTGEPFAIGVLQGMLLVLPLDGSTAPTVKVECLGLNGVVLTVKVEDVVNSSEKYIWVNVYPDNFEEISSALLSGTPVWVRAGEPRGTLDGIEHYTNTMSIISFEEVARDGGDGIAYYIAHSYGDGATMYSSSLVHFIISIIPPEYKPTEE